MHARLPLMATILLLASSALAGDSKAPAAPTAAAAKAKTPTAAELLARYDAAMGPDSYEALATMTAHRDDGSTRTYRMRMLKKGDDRFRLFFLDPATSRGQEILRRGDNAWLYMPNIKRSVRMANRDSFQGGDFNNADVMRVNYTADYEATLVEEPGSDDTWLLELKAKTPDASYDRVRLWMSRADLMPVKGEYYSASGKMLRSAEFSEVRDFGGLRRPAKVVMHNRLATKRFTEFVIDSFDTSVTHPASRFLLDDLGR